MKNFIREFREFALKGNLIDLAVGFILGGAVSALVKALVDFIISPIIGMVFGQPDFSRITLGSIQIGSFLNAVIAFLILAFVLFLMVRAVNRMFRQPAVEAQIPPTNEEVLLAEIRDLLRDSRK